MARDQRCLMDFPFRIIVFLHLNNMSLSLLPYLPHFPLPQDLACFLLPPIVFFLKSAAEKSISYQTAATRRPTLFGPYFTLGKLAISLAECLCPSLTQSVCLCMLSIQILDLIDKISITPSWLLVRFTLSVYKSLKRDKLLTEQYLSWATEKDQAGASDIKANGNKEKALTRVEKGRK